MILNYPFFDGENIVENASVEIEDGKIKRIVPTDEIDATYFLMPGLIDTHTHMGTMDQVKAMQKHGVTATCDVAASASLIQNAKPFTMISSAGMTMGTLNGKSYVKNAIADGADYIKVLLMEPNLMLKVVLKEICKTAHANGKKVAVHAVSVKAVRMAVDCDADILLHVPMKEEFPEELARMIAKKGIVVAPTLIMMETFAHSGKNGYQLEHYQNAERAVKLLYESGVSILAATDANPGFYAPAVSYGDSMHRELELLVQAGMTTQDALTSATKKAAEVFGIEQMGMIQEGKRADLILVEGRPDQKITDITKIKQVWIDGKTIL